MSLETRNRVTEQEFSPELAGTRIGWSAVTGYGKARPDEVFSIYVATATVSDTGASLEYEEREKDGDTIKAYWNDAAKGFIAMAGVTVIIDTEENLDETPRLGPYWSLTDAKIRGSSDGRILRTAGGGDEEKLEGIKLWANSSDEIIANVKKSMSDVGLADHYPNWYHTINMVLAHKNTRAGTPLGQLPVEATLMPDADMKESTDREIETATSILENLVEIDRVDESMIRNLTVFGEIPGNQIPESFKASRESVYGLETKMRTAYKRLSPYVGVYLPVGISRTWPYMAADTKPTDESSFGRELARLKEGDPSLASSELEYERKELEHRKEYAAHGVAALEVLRRLEGQA